MGGATRMSGDGSGDLGGRLTAIMDRWHFPIEPGCRQRLSGLISMAAGRHGGLTEAQIEYAETNFRRMLSEMTSRAQAERLTELHEYTFDWVFPAICPLFPFC